MLTGIPLIHLHWSDRGTVIIGYLLCLLIFTACGASRPPSRVAFAPVVQDDSDTLHRIEGDIENLNRNGSALNTFLKDTKALWPRGQVPYRIDTAEWEVGVEEAVFLDSQIENITQALRKIETGVPCIDFK